MGADNSGRRISSLDAWRFIAVTLVILSHLLLHSNLSVVVETAPYLRRLGRIGALGVQVFFVISGYVICLGLIREARERGTASLGAFYVRRAFRIIPPLAIYLAVIAFLGLIRPRQLAASALFLCNAPDPEARCSWWAAHTWSLAYEEQFYLLFPLVFVVLGFAHTPRRSVLIGLGSLIMLSLLVRAIIGGYPADYIFNASFLLVGCAGALLGIERIRLTGRAWLGLLLGFLIPYMLLPHPFELYVACVLPIWVFIIVLGAPLQTDSGRRVFENPGLAYVGRMSYSVYLWQQLATGKWAELPNALYVPMVAGVFLLAYLSWQWMELPLIRMGRRLSDRLLGTEAQAAPSRRTDYRRSRTVRARN
jgi:peptidoglycan/LPS O-acetylase OafA/YrhL